MQGLLPCRCGQCGTAVAYPPFQQYRGKQFHDARGYNVIHRLHTRCRDRHLQPDDVHPQSETGAVHARKEKEPPRLHTQSEQSDCGRGHQTCPGGRGEGRKTARIHAFQPCCMLFRQDRHAETCRPSREHVRQTRDTYIKARIQPARAVCQFISGELLRHEPGL